MFRQRTTENVVINVGLQWFGRILSVVSRVVLARLLVPDVFGLFAIASGFIGFVSTFGAFGLDYAIIQKGERATDEDYDVGMTLRVAIAMALFAVSVALAAPWAILFPKFDFVSVTVTTQILAAIYLITPWSFVPATHLTQELRYRTLAIPSIILQILNALLSIALAIAGFGVWALVYGYLVSQAVATAAYLYLRGGRFHFHFRGSVARPLVAYSVPLIFASVLTFLITNIDNFAVARILGPDPLGFYAVAYGFGYLPVSMFSSPAGGALFPSLTRIQKDVARLREAYLESFSYAIVLILPAGIGLSMLAHEIVGILLGDEWLAAWGALLVLGFYGVGRGMVDFSASLFAAVGTPRVIAWQNVYILILSLLLLWPFTVWWGIIGTSIAMTIPVLLIAGVSLRHSARTLQTRIVDFTDRLWGPLIAAETMGLYLYVMRTLMLDWLPGRIPIPLVNVSLNLSTAILVLGIASGMALFFALLRDLDPKVYTGLKHHLGLAIGGLPYLSR